MKKLVVYDLNKTLYFRSSKSEFFKFLCRHRPQTVFHIFKMLFAVGLFSAGYGNKTWFKQHFYSYLNSFKPEEVDAYARDFWNHEFPERFRSGFLKEIQNLKEEGVEIFIITGAYENYTKYLEKLLPVKVIGTRTEYKNGRHKIIGEACNDEEKVKRLKEEVNEEFEVLKAYSDDDEEILYLAKEGFYLEDGELIQVENKNRRE